MKNSIGKKIKGFLGRRYLIIILIVMLVTFISDVYLTIKKYLRGEEFSIFEVAVIYLFLSSILIALILLVVRKIQIRYAKREKIRL